MWDILNHAAIRESHGPVACISGRQPNSRKSAIARIEIHGQMSGSTVIPLRNARGRTSTSVDHAICAHWIVSTGTTVNVDRDQGVSTTVREDDFIAPIVRGYWTSRKFVAAV